jgi:glucosamine kinase
MIAFLLGVDGGGTGTRALVVRRADGAVLGRGEAGPSALGQGIAPAWRAVQHAIGKAFESAGMAQPPWSQCALGAGMSGVHNPQWRDAFLTTHPGFAKMALDTDGYTMLLGAHGGQPGVMIAVGTGSVGEALRRDGAHVGVSGWGFPSGDESSGAWLGLRAMRIAQCAMDGRLPAGNLAQAVWRHCGQQRDALQAWCGQAGQFAYAQLAPLVFDSAASDPAAEQLLQQAAADLAQMAQALDPQGDLPLAVCGSVGKMLLGRLPTALQGRCVEAQQDATGGAILLIRDSLGTQV